MEESVRVVKKLSLLGLLLHMRIYYIELFRHYLLSVPIG